MNKAKELLKKHWGYTSFRAPQEQIIKTVLEKKDVFVLLPTGAGKSLCYQLPALLQDGICLVVSPLIALMEDQTAHLKELGLAAERIHSGRTRLQSRVVSRDYLDGNLDFLFIAPFKLIPIKRAIKFFDIINFLLLSGSPEVVISSCDTLADLL